MSAKIYNRIQNNFTQVSNAALLDIRLSGKAYKLYAYMVYRLGTAPDWEFNENEILRHFKESRDAIRTAFNELITAGWLIRRRAKASDGRFVKSEYEIFSEPQTPDSSPQTDFPSVDDPAVDKPAVVNPAQAQPAAENTSYNNKDIINKELNNKDISLSGVTEFCKELKERENYSFEINCKKIFDYLKDEGELRNGWKNIVKKLVLKPENQIIKSIPPGNSSIRNSIKAIASAADYEFYFKLAPIKDNTIYVTDKRALTYKDALANINIKLELK